MVLIFDFMRNEVKIFRKTVSGGSRTTKELLRIYSLFGEEVPELIEGLNGYNSDVYVTFSLLDFSYSKFFDTI